MNGLWLKATLVGLACGLSTLAPTGACAQIDFEREPINYPTPTADEPITRLQARLDRKEIVLDFDAARGYLPAVLSALGIDPSSQVLVFSKTSFQLSRISPQRPRAIYFNDDVYIGWVQGGDVLEISSADPHQGGMFYTLEQEPREMPRFTLDRGQCLSCHASSRTQGVPGHLMRSVYADRSGQPLLGSGTFNLDHTSPFEQRWGGWYVSGTHGEMRHMGNVISEERVTAEQLDRESGANLVHLDSLVDLRPYLASTSDIVALMVLEHQVQMHNLIAAANYETRHALYYDSIMNAALERPADYRSESTDRRIAAAGEKLLRYLLYCGEYPLNSPVAGSTEYRTWFESQGPRDSRGRSLRDFELETRLFRYPCSYLIGSDAFAALPDPIRQYVVRRLYEVLTHPGELPEEYNHLTRELRQSIFEILTETQPELWEGMQLPALSDSRGPGSR